MSSSSLPIGRGNDSPFGTSPLCADWGEAGEAGEAGALATKGCPGLRIQPSGANHLVAATPYARRFVLRESR